MGEDFPKRTVLIGAGMVARTHLMACAHASGVSLRGIHSRNLERARKLALEGAAQTGLPLHVYDSLEAVADDPEVDFAIVLTPPNARLEIIKVLVSAGKHILLEKPVGRTATEAHAVVRLCREAGVTLGIVFQHRLRESSQKAAQMIAHSGLGALGLVEISVPWWRDQSYYNEMGRGTYERDGGGVLISQAIHTIDLALSLAGPVASVRAMAATSRFHSMEAEDFATAGLLFANGALGSLVASTASYPGDAESITLHFEKASLRLNSGRLFVQWRNGNQESFGAIGGTGGGADPMAFTHEWHQNVIENFATSLATGTRPAITGEDALRAHELIDAILTSARSGTVTELNS